MKTFSQTVIALRKKDYTLPEIIKETGRPKTSIYHHIRNIPLSARKKRQVSAASRVRALALSLKRKGRSRRIFAEISRWNADSTSLVAHLLFDGEISSHACIYSNRSSTLIARVTNLFSDYYAYPPSHYTDKKTGVRRVSYFNVALATHMRQKATELLRIISNMNTSCIISFLRAFFDDEGCVDFREKRNLRRVRGYQKDLRVLKLVKKLLNQIGIESRIVQPNEIVIAGKKNLMRFQSLVGFSPGVRINGKRSNSIWKQSHEKRLLLKKAIASFKK